MSDFDVAVVGAGVIGLAVAARLAGRAQRVVVIERRGGIGRETSSRNSGVIHAGLYYHPGSRMARLCVEGRHLLEEYCVRRSIAHRRIGKLVVATSPDDQPHLEALLARAHENGVDDARLVDAAQVARLEPAVSALSALHSPSTGIVDVHAFMAALQGDAESRGAAFALRTELVAIAPGYRLTTCDAAGERFDFTARAVVNAAGLRADRVAALAGIDVDAAGYRQRYWRGQYFSLPASTAARVTRLVYPVRRSDAPGLGIHLTLDLGGRARLGPDATYLAGITEPDEIDYRVDAAHGDAFFAVAARYLPFLSRGDLAPDFAGVRPRLSLPGEPQRDFVIAEESARGLSRFVNLVGIESPGLTASLAIAREVERLLDEADE